MTTKKYLFVYFLCISTFLYQCQSVAPRDAAVVVRLAGEPDALHPYLTNQLEGLQIASYLYQPLLDYDPQSLDLKPVLLEKMPSIRSVEGRLSDFYKAQDSIYAFDIHPKATWSDGRPVTGYDVAFTLKVLAYTALASDLGQQLRWVRHIVVDPQNPKHFDCLAADVPWDALHNWAQLPILPAHIFDPDGLLQSFDLSAFYASEQDKIQFFSEKIRAFDSLWVQKTIPTPDNLMGSGAYAFVRWEAGAQIVLQRKDKWWGQGLSGAFFEAEPSVLVFKIVKDGQAAVSLVQNGQLDVVSKLPPKAFLNLQKNDSVRAAYQFGTAPTATLWHIGLNCKSPFLTDPKVRRALAHLLDIELIIKELAFGFATPCAAPFIPQRPYYDKTLQPIRYDTAAAVQLLTAAGWTDSNRDGLLDKQIGGQKRPFILDYIVVAQNEMGKNIGLILQANARKVGVEIRIKTLESGVYTEKLAQRAFDMFILGSAFSPAPDDPEGRWASWHNTPMGGNRYQFSDAVADSLIRHIQKTTDSTARIQYYKAFQQRIYETQPALFLFVPQERLVVHRRFDMAFLPKRPHYNLGAFRLK